MAAVMAEHIDIEDRQQLLAYLRGTGRIDEHEQPRTRTLRGGVSNRTVLVTRDTGEAWVLKQALAKLRVAVDWFSDPKRIHREAAGLRWLDKLIARDLPGAITPLVFEDEQHHILAMQAVPQPHENWKTLLLAGRVETHHVEQFAMLLATIHRRGFEQRGEVAKAFDDRSFFESLRLEPYYAYAAQQVGPSRPFMDELIAETRAARLTLVHGDYSPKNILVYHDRLVLLDHEVIHFGDPAFDVGFSMTHLLSKTHHLREHRSAFVEASQRYWRCYADSLGEVPWRDALEPRAVRHTLGCMLARVAGRSPLEYLSDSKRQHQQEVVVSLMSRQFNDMATLIERFVEAV